MASNQQRAIDLANDIVEGKRSAPELTEEEWNLILLASGLNDIRTLPLLVCHRIMTNKSMKTGFFSPTQANDRDVQAPAGATIPSETLGG
jgi:hypothetical protein